MTVRDCLKAALVYARRGWAVFPLDGKRPFSGTHGHRDATIDRSQIKKWWRRWPDANVGIACSSLNGPIIVDVDGPLGEDAVAAMDLPLTREATSGRPNRRHLYFKPASNGALIKRLIKVKPSLDILGDGGYVVAPPSKHPTAGTTYRWLNHEILVPFPKKLIKLLGRTNGKKGQAEPLPERIGEGRRDELLTSLAGSMRRRGASEEAILAALREENERRCDPPLPDKQLMKIARSIARKAPAGFNEHQTDLGNARRFIAQHREDVRHVKIWRQPWLIWDGVRWAQDDTGEAERLAKGTIRLIYQEAAHVEDPDEREGLLRHAAKSEQSSRLRGLLELASTEPEVSTTGDAFDADPWTLNVENGTLNLKRRELHKHDREDHLTKLAPVIYDPKATCPRWDRFLRQIMNHDEELVDYLQRAIGYALTGDTREHCLFFCYGQGRNGKSTFLEVIRDVLGDYAQQSDFSTFLSKRGDGPRNDLARMRGARMITAIEAQSDRAFDETVLKQLTGGDTIVARRLYEEFFEFKPVHKLFLAANHKPMVREQTEAFWSRIRLIPFTVTIPLEKRDKNLGKKLRTEMSGILNWALEGCERWQAEGLAEPRAVNKATRSYREENDIIGEFLSGKCVLMLEEWTSTTELYGAFCDWWLETRGPRVPPFSPGWFGRSLGERPQLRALKQNHIRGWKGITIKMEARKRAHR